MKPAAKRRPGRPPAGPAARLGRLTLRLTAEERAAWEARAAAAGAALGRPVTLAEWVRSRCSEDR